MRIWNIQISLGRCLAVRGASYITSGLSKHSLKKLKSQVFTWTRRVLHCYAPSQARILRIFITSLVPSVGESLLRASQRYIWPPSGYAWQSVSGIQDKVIYFIFRILRKFHEKAFLSLDFLQMSYTAYFVLPLITPDSPQELWGRGWDGGKGEDANFYFYLKVFVCVCCFSLGSWCPPKPE